MTEIQSLISKKLKPLAFGTRFEDLVPILEQTRYSHLPVVENDIYMGSLAIIDVVPSETNTVGDFRYALLPYFVRKDAGWFEVLEKFAQFDCNVLAVLDENNQYTGYYFQETVFPFLNNTPFLKENGLNIVVEKHYMDYSISEIAQIVETNNSKLLGIFVSAIENDRAQITIKAATGNINEIIQTFRRFGYEVVSEHNQDIYLNELKNRSAYLDKYLNI